MLLRAEKHHLCLAHEAKSSAEAEGAVEGVPAAAGLVAAVTGGVAFRRTGSYQAGWSWEGLQLGAH